MLSAARDVGGVAISPAVLNERVVQALKCRLLRSAAVRDVEATVRRASTGRSAAPAPAANLADAMEDELELLGNLQEVASLLIRWQGLDAVAMLESQKVIPLIASLVQADVDNATGTLAAARAHARMTAICLVDDLVEFSTPPPEGLEPPAPAPTARTAPLSRDHPANKYVGSFMAALPGAAGADDADMAQCALHGLGLLAERGGKQFTKQAAVAAADMAVRRLQAPNAFGPRTRGASTAAVVLLARLIAHRGRALEGLGLGPVGLRAALATGLGQVMDANDRKYALKNVCASAAAENGVATWAEAAQGAAKTPLLVAMARTLAAEHAAQSTNGTCDAHLVATISALARSLNMAEEMEAAFSAVLGGNATTAVAPTALAA